MKCHCTRIRMSKMFKTDYQALVDGEHLELSYTASRKVKWHNYFGNSLEVFYKS